MACANFLACFFLIGLCLRFFLLYIIVRATESPGEFGSQKTIRKVRGRFSEVCTIRSEALKEVKLNSTQEEEEMGL